MNESNVFEAFQSAGNILVYVFQSIFSFLQSSGLTRAIIYVFILGTLLSVLKLLIGGRDE